jgi:adenylyl cyclase-associated protein
LQEHFANKNDLVLSDTEIKQTVYIFQCKNCTIKVQGKVNSISLDSCERVALLFDDVLSTVEFINSKSVQAQVTGKVPTISIDKTDGCQFYLSKKSLDAEIVTAKSSAVNILVPDKQGDEYTEYPLPEQFKTIFTNQKPVTTPIESA